MGAVGKTASAAWAWAAIACWLPAAAGAEAGQPAAARPAFLIPVPLPIRGTLDIQVRQLIDRALERLGDGGPRPLVVLEFRDAGRADPGASQFERCLGLALHLAGRGLSGAETVAYLPQSVTGHAVLPVLACGRIVMAPDAQLGDAGAGLGEEPLDETMRRAYEEVARRRRTVPPAMAVAMLDRNEALYKVETAEGVRFVLGDELASLEQSAAVRSVTTLSREGEPALFTAHQLAVEHGLAAELAADRAQLAALLGLAPGALREDPSLVGGWRGVRVDVVGRIQRRTASHVAAAVRRAAADESINLICLYLDSPGGSLADSMRLANALAELDPAEVRTVAFVAREARGDAALIALACDELVMAEDALLGGPGDYALSDAERREVRTPIRRLAEAKGRDWSLMGGLLDPDLAVHAWRNERTGQVRYWCPDERQEREGDAPWVMEAPVDLAEGVRAERALQLGLAARVVGGWEELEQIYGVDQLESPSGSPLVEKIERLAAQPWLARTLLFIAFFALISEASAPGLGLPGFVAVLCFLLFFWCQFLNGTAVWLDVVLFVGGLASLALELFVLPGFGVFGAGGLLMILASIILASQTFVLPANSYQVNQLLGSLITAAVAVAGAAGGLGVIHRFAPDVPLLRRLVLKPPAPEEREAQERRESLADFGRLVGQHGVAITPLTPAGKVQFGEQRVSVVSDGQWVDAGQPVVVIQAQGNRVVVRPSTPEG